MAQGVLADIIWSANADASQPIAEAVRALTLNFGDPNSHLTQARVVDPACVTANILQAWILTLSNNGIQIARARELIDSIAEAGLTRREAQNLAALRFATRGR